MVRYTRIAFLLLLSSAGLAGAADTGVWLGVREPREGFLLTGPVPMVEVSGRAGARKGGRQDVVIALDVSASTLVASGIDVNGDGEIGSDSLCLSSVYNRLYAWPRFQGRRPPCKEAFDTLRAAEIAAAGHLLALLDPDLTRVGLVTFSDAARLRSPLDSPREAVERTLWDIDLRHSSLDHGTDFRRAIATALDAFQNAPPYPPHLPVERSILFLSDGQPTLPGIRGHPARKALEAAERADRENVRIYTFALGPKVSKQPRVYFEIADSTGGLLTTVEKPGDIIAELPRVNLAAVAQITMRNVTTDRPGRAVRVFPDGSFDGYVPLARGENHLRITARGRLGREMSLDRIVRFEPREPTTPEEIQRRNREIERFVKTLRERTTETEQIYTMDRIRGWDKQLTLRAGSVPWARQGGQN